MHTGILKAKLAAKEAPHQVRQVRLTYEYTSGLKSSKKKLLGNSKDQSTVIEKRKRSMEKNAVLAKSFKIAFVPCKDDDLRRLNHI